MNPEPARSAARVLDTLADARRRLGRTACGQGVDPTEAARVLDAFNEVERAAIRVDPILIAEALDAAVRILTDSPFGPDAIILVPAFSLHLRRLARSAAGPD